MNRRCPLCGTKADAVIDAVGVWTVYPCNHWLSPDTAIEVPWTPAEINHHVRVANRRQALGRCDASPVRTPASS